MKKLTLLLAFITVSTIFTSCAQKRDKTVESITAKELHQKQNGIVLIDVRTPEEFADGYIKNAKNINFYDDSFMNKINKLDKKQPVYIYCKKGGRSAKAAQKLKAAGFEKVYDLEGGISQWKDDNFELVK